MQNVTTRGLVVTAETLRQASRRVDSLRSGLSTDRRLDVSRSGGAPSRYAQLNNDAARECQARSWNGCTPSVRCEWAMSAASMSASSRVSQFKRIAQRPESGQQLAGAIDIVWKPRSPGDASARRSHDQARQSRWAPRFGRRRFRRGGASLLLLQVAVGADLVSSFLVPTPIDVAASFGMLVRAGASSATLRHHRRLRRSAARFLATLIGHCLQAGRSHRWGQARLAYTSWIVGLNAAPSLLSLYPLFLVIVGRNAATDHRPWRPSRLCRRSCSRPARGCRCRQTRPARCRAQLRPHAGFSNSG